MHAETDELLLRRTPREPDAFAELYRRHERLVVRFFLSRGVATDVAADLAAETFAAALLSARRYRPDQGPAVAWLLGIARNQLLRSLRRNRVESAARAKLAMPPLVLDDAVLNAIDELAAEQGAESWLAELPDDQAAAIRARVLDEKEYREIAGELRCSEAVVRKRVSRGLATLRASKADQKGAT